MVCKVRVHGIPLATKASVNCGVSPWWLTDWGLVTAGVVASAINPGMGGMASRAGMTVLTS